MNTVTITAVSERAAKAAFKRITNDSSNNLISDKDVAHSDVLTVRVEGSEVKVSSSYYYKFSLVDIANKAKGKGKVS